MRKPETPFKPTPQQIRDAYGKTVPDLLAPNLKVLFVGINPGLYTAAIGRHFGRPGNRFWPALYSSGFTPRLFSPFESERLLDLSIGITNMVQFATLRADELTQDQLRAGGKVVIRKIKKFRPRWAAILGVVAYRIAFDSPKAQIGLQRLQIGPTRFWVLPNPSGLNAHFTPKTLSRVFGDLRRAVEDSST